jgi:hypothetical protein
VSRQLIRFPVCCTFLPKRGPVGGRLVEHPVCGLLHWFGQLTPTDHAQLVVLALRLDSISQQLRVSCGQLGRSGACMIVLALHRLRPNPYEIGVLV